MPQYPATSHTAPPSPPHHRRTLHVNFFVYKSLQTHTQVNDTGGMKEVVDEKQKRKSIRTRVGEQQKKKIKNQKQNKKIQIKLIPVKNTKKAIEQWIYFF